MAKKPTYEELEQRVRELEGNSNRDGESKNKSEMESFCEATIYASADAMVIADEDAKVLLWNPSAEKIFGYKEKEMIGRHFHDLIIPEENRERVTKQFGKAVRTGTLSHYGRLIPTEGLRKDGSRFPLEHTISMFETNGKLRLVAILRDMTVQERMAELKKALAAAKQAEEKVVESQRELTVRNRIADIFLTRPETDMYGEVLDVILDIMESRYGFFGYINEEGNMVAPSMTKEIFDKCQMPGKDIIFRRRDWVGIWGQTLLEKKTIYANKGLHLPKGHVALARAMTVPIVYQEELVGILAVADKETDYDESNAQTLEAVAADIASILRVRMQRDFEEKTRRETEKKLQASLSDTEQARDRIDGIIKSVADGLIVTDIYSRIVLMNRAAEDLLGVRFSEVIDRPIDFAIKEKALREKVRETLEKKTTGYHFDFELPSDDPKNPRIMRARTSVIHDREGKDSGIVTIIHDVTHEREVDRMKTEFISTAAHELRTPLTSIQGFSEILLMREDLKAEEKKKFLTYINKQSVGLAMIINDLLDISRIESGRGFSLDKVPCNAGDAIQEILPYFQEQYKNHQFEVVLPEKPVQLHVDKEKVGQVLKNLLSNAAKYSPEGALIRTVVEKFKDHCRISVQDQGMGMTPEQVDKIFDKFYRVDASNTAIEGTGLGMTVVKHIVEAHGGEVWVESEVGKGTVVTFTIPI